jgi:hypothetical protein
MARIKTYTIDTLISDNDIIIGSDADNNNETKNFPAGLIREFVLSGLEPEVGGNLKITTIVDNDSEETTPEDYFNNSVIPIVVLHYEIVFLILNGRTFIFRKNNDVYGEGETQVASGDFTEIDITSVINANRQDLDSVLTEGNESADKNIFINKVYLWDNVNGDYGSFIEGSKESLNIYKAGGSSIGTIKDKEIKMNSGAFLFNIVYPSISTNRNATFQNASGTIAYLSDIPSDYIIDVFSNSDEISVTNNDGEIELTYNEQKDVVLLKTYLINTLTNTTYYGDGGVFSFDETEEPINALKLSFEEDIVSNSPANFGYIAFHYKNGDNAIYTIPTTGHSISGTDLTVRLPLIDYWSVDLSYFSIHLLVGCVSSDTSGRSFKGLTPSAITNYYNFSSLIV